MKCPNHCGLKSPIKEDHTIGKYVVGCGWTNIKFQASAGSASDASRALLFSRLPHNHLVFKIDIIIEISEDIHTQQSAMGYSRPFVVDHQDVGAS